MTTTWNPNHPSTINAWSVVHASLTERASRGLWGSRSMAATLARSAGLTPKRAEDLIASAIRHGYLEERPSPLDTGHHTHPTQVRLRPDLMEADRG